MRLRPSSIQLILECSGGEVDQVVEIHSNKLPHRARPTPRANTCRRRTMRRCRPHVMHYLDRSRSIPAPRPARSGRRVCDASSITPSYRIPIDGLARGPGERTTGSQEVVGLVVLVRRTPWRCAARAASRPRRLELRRCGRSGRRLAHGRRHPAVLCPARVWGMGTSGWGMRKRHHARLLEVGRARTPGVAGALRPSPTRRRAGALRPAQRVPAVMPERHPCAFLRCAPARPPSRALRTAPDWLRARARRPWRGR